MKDTFVYCFSQDNNSAFSTCVVIRNTVSARLALETTAQKWLANLPQFMTNVTVY